MTNIGKREQKQISVVRRRLTAMLLSVLVSVPVWAGQRTPQQQASPQATDTRVAVPRDSADRGSTGSRQPTARDTRRIPPEQYRPPASRSQGSPSHRSHVGIHFGYHYPYYYPSYWTWGYWGPYWHWPPYWDYPPLRRGRYFISDMGALDLNVKPKKASVYVDGQHVGRVKAFDGFPGYLWLESGTYDITFFMEGYRTESRRVVVRKGLVIDMWLRMEPGEAIAPEDILATRQLPEADAADAPTGAPQTWPPETHGSAEVGQQGRALADDTGRLQFVVEPGDASVYLDGRFLGSGDELGSLHAGLIVEAGRHLVEVVRPGYMAQRLNIFVESGGQLDINIEMVTEEG